MQQGSRPRPPIDNAHVAVVVVNYRTADLAKRCLASLESERRYLPQLKVLIVDGGSDDGSAEALASTAADERYVDWVSILPLPVNGGFGWANNQAIARLLRQPDSPEFIHLLNPDSEILEGAVAFLLKYLKEHPKAGAVGSQLLELDGSVSGSAFTFPSLRGEFARGARTGLVDWLLKVPPVLITAPQACEVDWATGASVMFRSDALKRVGLFDEGFFLYHEEIELMWRLRRQGWTIAFEPLSRVLHVGGASTGVHSRPTADRIDPRKPSYWYRSRTRFFALTRGQGVAILAYFLWFVGYFIRSTRRFLGLAKGSRLVSHQVRDHARYAFPRRYDRQASVRAWSDEPSQAPAWMRRGSS